jgi:hypothetical protein
MIYDILTIHLLADHLVSYKPSICTRSEVLSMLRVWRSLNLEKDINVLDTYFFLLFHKVFQELAASQMRHEC